MTLNEVMDNCGQVRIKGTRKTVAKAYWFMLEDYHVVSSRRLSNGTFAYTVVPGWIARAEKARTWRA